MHCPACDKEFSPVHSRCPDCNGWLRTKPTVGAKAARANPGTDLENAPTNKLNAPVMGGNVNLPSRPTKPVAAPPQPPPSMPGRSGGLGGDMGPAPGPGPSLDAPAGRGALGSGWESSGSFAVPAGQWGMPTETGKLPAFGAGQAGSGGLGAGPGPLGGPVLGGPSGLGAGSNSLGGGPAGFGAPSSFGGPAGFGAAPGAMGSASNGLGAPSAGFGAAPAGPQASMHGPPATQSGPPGGGWLGGDSSGAAPAAPARTGWAVDASAESAGPGARPSMPSMPSASEAPALALPDHTVFVDMETPWEEETSQGSSNKVIYMVLGCLVLGLTCFSGYIFYQNKMLKTPPPVVSKEKGGDSVSVGLDSLKMAKQAYKNKKWEEAQQSAELARNLIVPLKVAPPATVKEVKKFFEKATTRCAQSMFDKANRAAQTGDSRMALAYCRDAAKMYGKLPKTGSLQAKAYGLEGRIYQRDGDSASAESAFRKAHSLHPGGGYDSLARQARQSGAPIPVQAPSAGPEPSIAEQPTLGGDPAYPTGTSGGGYRPSAPPPAQPAAPAAGPAKVRPVNTYVPPKRPSNSGRKSDQLPTYNR